MNSIDKYIIVKAKGGMGNRMLCAITGIIYGLLSNRKILMDWRDGGYGELGENSFNHYFDSSVLECIQDEIKTNDVFPSIWKANLDKAVGQIIDAYYPNQHSSFLIHRKLSIDVRKLDYPQEVVVFWHYQHRIKGLMFHFKNKLDSFSGLSVHEVLSKAIKYYLPLSPLILQKIEDYYSTYFKGKIIGIHIRYSDRQTNLNAYEKAVSFFLKRNPDARIFLATDNIQILDYYKNKYVSVLSTPKWYPPSSIAMHQNQSCPNRIINGEEALIDMYLLSRCDYLIYSGWSTFSLISRLVSNIPTENIVDIDKYNLTVRFKQWLRDTLP